MGDDPVQVDLLSGVYTDTSPDFRSSYPVNLVPVPKATGISESYLRPADGVVFALEGPGPDRGGCVWRGVHYRVMGSHFGAIVSGAFQSIGSVTGTGPARFDYSFDYLAIASGERLYLYAGGILRQVTDTDLGLVNDMIWIDGYFMTTDGNSLVVTELDNPFAVNPIKYGSSEADPDPVQSLFRLRTEVVAVNRHTIEYFENTGGELFPFQRIEGAQVQKGAVGRYSACLFQDLIAFVGGGRGEAIGVYLGANAQAVKISTQEIDTIIAGYSDAQIAAIEVEQRTEGSHQFLYVHLPDRTLVYDAGASAELQQRVWFALTTAVEGFEAYQARYFTLFDGKWWCGNGPSLGYLDRNISSHWGRKVRHEIGTIVTYNEGRGAIFHEIELVALTGAVALDEKAVISTSYSVDGLSWSQDKVISAGKTAQRGKRLVWFQNGVMYNWRCQRFRWDSDIRMTPARLEVRAEGLAY